MPKKNPPIPTYLWPCNHCGRTLGVCDGEGPDENGYYTYARCRGCSDVFAGRHSALAREALNFIPCSIEGAWKDSKDATAVEYVSQFFEACRDGYPGLAANYLKLISRNNAPVLMALQNACTK